MLKGALKGEVANLGYLVAGMDVPRCARGRKPTIKHLFRRFSRGCRGRGPPTKKPTLKSAGKKGKALNLSHSQGRLTIAGLTPLVTRTWW